MSLLNVFIFIDRNGPSYFLESCTSLPSSCKRNFPYPIRSCNFSIVPHGCLVSQMDLVLLLSLPFLLTPKCIIPSDLGRWKIRDLKNLFNWLYRFRNIHINSENSTSIIGPNRPPGSHYCSQESSLSYSVFLVSVSLSIWLPSSLVSLRSFPGIWLLTSTEDLLLFLFHCIRGDFGGLPYVDGTGRYDLKVGDLDIRLNKHDKIRWYKNHLTMSLSCVYISPYKTYMM